MHNSKMPIDTTPHTPFPLPDPLPELLPASDEDDSERQKTYFDPSRWDTQADQPPVPDERDPVENDLGKQEGSGTAALILSDFHVADGSTGGDDFLDSHLHRDEQLGFQVGFFPPGQSRARLVAAVMTFALQRVRQVGSGGSPHLDVVLNGDVINFLELKGRGGTLVSPKHLPLFRALDALQGRAVVYWLRGNHDYVVPPGPWRRGEFYVNPQLQTLVEHGDFWDKENWPPGVSSKGSRLVLEAVAAFEALANVTDEGCLKYLMSGVDNLRPVSDQALKAFLDRRRKYSEVAWLAALLARLKILGAADDSAAYQGALTRREQKYRAWLMVQGHTHIPAFAAGLYYNTGSWIPSLVAPDGEERHLEVFPFLLIYLGQDGQRVEEYYTACQEGPDEAPTATLHTESSINALRKEYGYKELGKK